MINLIKLYKGIKSRYTIHRILMGSKLSNFNFSTGYTLDISSEKHTSYEKEWNIELKNLINIDIDIEGKPNILADINNLPFKNNSISNFGCFNVLELLQFPKIAIEEIYRVLNKSGYLVGYVPFLYPIHNQPVDYWRFSNNSLHQILNDGEYFLQVSLTDERVVHTIERDILKFSVNDQLDPSGVRGNYKDPWPPASVRPRLNWKSKIIKAELKG